MKGTRLPPPRAKSPGRGPHDPSAHDFPYAIGAMLSDPYGIRILIATHERSRSAAELCRSLHIPMAGCYRRLHEMVSLGLIGSEEGPPGRNGKREASYRSRVDRLRVALEEGKLHAHVQFHAPSGHIENADVEVPSETVTMRSRHAKAHSSP